MICWTAFAIMFAAMTCGVRIVTDWSPAPPRAWQRPRTWGQSVFVGTIVWSLGWFGPVLWRHRSAFDRPNLGAMGPLFRHIAANLPAGIGVPAFGLGVLLLSGAFVRVGSAMHCRRCGYARGASDRLVPLCPECGHRWSWHGETAVGRPVFDRARAAAGLTLMGLGAATFVVQFFP